MRKYLTDRAVKAARPDPQRRLEIADAGFQGLYLIVQSSGSKSWAVRYRAGSRSRKATLGSCPPIDLKAARQRAKDALELLDRGLDPGAEKIAARRRQHAPSLDPDAFGVQARLYLTRHCIPHTRSWKETARNLGLKPDPETPGAFVDIAGGLAQRWAALPVQAITRRMILEAVDEAVDRGAPIAANRLLGILARLFNWLLSRDVLKVAPTTGIKRPTVERARERVLSDAEIAALWEATGALGYPFGTITRLLLLTGQRRQECAGATWGEFDFDDRLWRIAGERTKNGRPHHVQLSDAVLRLLEDVPLFASGSYLFGASGRTAFSGFSRAKRRLDELAGIEPFSIHDLRRTCASGMSALGTPPHVIERILNHVSGARASVAGIYDRSSLDDERRDALERWARHIERLVDPAAAANVVELRGR